MKDRHCWGFDDSDLPDESKLVVVDSFAHAYLDDCPVTLYRAADRKRPSWISYPRRSWRKADGADGHIRAGAVVREWCPVIAEQVADFGKEIETRMACGACGHLSWVEIDRAAAGQCQRCGYHG